MTMRVLIVGGSDAGISAALRARELDQNAEITVLLADDFPNYSICGLPFYLSGETPDWKSSRSSNPVRRNYDLPRPRGHPHRCIREKGFGDGS